MGFSLLNYIRFWIVWLLLGIFVPVRAQINQQLRGKLLTVERQPAAQVTVSIFPERDSTRIHSTITDVDGIFRLAINDSGPQIIQTRSPAFLPLRQRWANDSASNQTLELTLQIKTLQEVNVKAKRETFQEEPGKLTVNVANSSLLNGGTTLDILEKTPHLQVDPISKSISIDGKPGVQVYVNNRQIQLTQDQITKYLQGIPANTIERIDVLLTPGARFDAAAGGVINIVLKRNEAEGTSLDLNISPGVGRYGKLNSSLNFSVRRAKWSIYALYTPQIRTTYFSYVVSQQLNHEPIIGSTTGDQFRKVYSRQHGLRLGGEWNVTRQLVVGVNMYGFQERDETTTSSQTGFAYTNQAPQTVAGQTIFSNFLSNRLFNLNGRQSFSNKKHVLSADIDIASYTDNATTAATYQTNGQPGSNSLQSYFPVTIELKSGKADLVSTVAPGLTLESGVKLSRSAIHATPAIIDYSPVFSTLVDKLIQPFQYNESVEAAYASLSGAWRKINGITYQAGLRYEHTLINVISPAAQFDRNYYNLFPSVNIQKKFLNKAQFTISYNRRIIRPNFSSLNPIYIFLDPYTITLGNPYLTPQYSNNLQLSYQLPNRHTFSLVALENRNRITEVVYRQDTLSPVLYNTQLNFNRERRLTGSYSFPLVINKAWKMQTTVSGALLHFSTPVNNQTVTIDASALSLNNMHVFTLGNSWTADLQIIARTSTALGFMYYKPLLSINMGLGRPLWRNRGSIKLSGADVFHTVTIENYGEYGFTNVHYRHRYETQTFFATLTYRFGNEKLKQIDSHKTASESEQERLQK